MSNTAALDWDFPHPEMFKSPWDDWVQFLVELERVCIRRQYSDHSYTDSSVRLVHVFCDASKDAIGALHIYISSDLSVQSPHSVFFYLERESLHLMAATQFLGWNCAPQFLALK